MKSRSRLLAATLGAVLFITSCTSGSTAETSTTAAPTTTGTSVATTTTAAPPETTTTAPLAHVSVTGDLPGDMSWALTLFLSAIQDHRNDADIIDQDLLYHHRGLEGMLSDSYVGTASTQTFETGESVGVVTLDNGDIVLVAGEGSNWEVVGAHLASVDTDPWFGRSPRFVLVLGSDGRTRSNPSGHHMDSIHVLTAVPAERSGTILGWPRDSWVSTPYGEMRVNAIATSGRGPDPLVDHFVNEWDVPVEGYILTSFPGFEDMIEAAVGRLVITLPTAVPVQDWWPAFSPGEQTLTPERTLDFSRTRKRLYGGDLTRSWHQGIVMLAVLTMLQQGSVEDVPVLLGELVKHTETNLTPTDLLQLGAAAFSMDVGEITNEVLPGSLGRAGNGSSVIFLDPEADDIIADVVDDGLREATEG